MNKLSHNLGFLCIELIMVFMMISGILKLADLASFEIDLRTWTLLPAYSLNTIAILVPTTELFLAGLWLLRIAQRLALLTCIGMIALYTIAFLMQLAIAQPPNCGCLGLLQRYHDQQTSASSLLVRNAVLLAGLLVGGRLSGFLFQSKLRFIRHRFRQDRIGSPNGFTLIETIMVIGLIGLLFGLLMPALSHAKKQVYRLDAIADLRANMEVLNAYTLDYDDQWPFITDPEATYTMVYHPRGRKGPILYFEASMFWYWPLLDGYYGGDGDEIFYSMDDNLQKHAHGEFTSYMYSSTMYTRPEFWNAYKRIGPKQWRPVRIADVIFPTAKGALVSNIELLPYYYSYYNPQDSRLRIGFCDGSAANILKDKILYPYIKGEGNWWGAFNTPAQQVLHTIDGVYGRDRN